MEALAPRHTLAVSLRGAVPSDAPAAGYSLPQLEVVTFAESGHDPRRPDRERFAAVLRAFAERLD